MSVPGKKCARVLALLALLCLGAVAQEAPSVDAAASAYPAVAAAAAAKAPSPPPPPVVVSRPRPPPPAVPAPPPPPPEFDSVHEAEVARNNSIAKLQHCIQMAQEKGLDQPILRDAMAQAVSLGISSSDVLTAKQLLQEFAKKTIDEAIAQQGDVLHDKMHKLTYAVRQAELDGHTGPHVVAAKKLRNDKISAAIDAAGNAEDLAKLHTYLEHARIHASDDLGTVIAAAEKRLHDKAALTVSQHKIVGATNHGKLRDAIDVCRAEGIESQHLAKADLTLVYEEARQHLKLTIPGLIKGNHYSLLVQHVALAAEHGLADPEVADAKKHVALMAREMVGQASKGGTSASTTVRRLAEGPNGTTIEVEETVPGKGEMGIGDMERALLAGIEQGLSEMELSGVRSVIQLRVKARLQAAMAPQITLSTAHRLEKLDELLAAVEQQALPEVDKQSGRSSLQTKVTALLAESSAMGWTTKPMAFLHYSEILSFASRPNCGLDVATLETHITAYQTAFMKEMEAATLLGEQDRLWKAGIAREAFEVVLHRFPQLRDPSYDDLKDLQSRAEAKAFKRSTVLADLDRLATKMTNRQDALKGLREILSDCENDETCSSADRAPYQAKVTELVKEMEPPAGRSSSFAAM